MTILGAGGFAKELLVALDLGAPGERLFFFDNVSENAPGLLFGRFPVVRSWPALKVHFSENGRDFCIGVGRPSDRESLCATATGVGGTPVSVIAGSASVGRFGVVLGAGCYVGPGALVENDVWIGEGSLINYSAMVGHDVRLGEYCEVSPGAKLLGKCRVGRGCTIGANAVILPGVAVGDRCIVGAGAVVTRDVPPGVTVVGVPARPTGPA